MFEKYASTARSVRHPCRCKQLIAVSWLAPVTDLNDSQACRSAGFSWKEEEGKGSERRGIVFVDHAYPHGVAVDHYARSLLGKLVSENIIIVVAGAKLRVVRGEGVQEKQKTMGKV